MSGKDEIQLIITYWQPRLKLYRVDDYVDIKFFLLNFSRVLCLTREMPPEISGFMVKSSVLSEYRIFSNSCHKEDRQRFSMAHMLGHYAIHKHLLGEGSNENFKYQNDDKYPCYNPLITQTMENQANTFALGVLMPYDLVKSNLKGRDLDEILVPPRLHESGDKVLIKDKIAIISLALMMKVTKWALISRLTDLTFDRLRESCSDSCDDEE